MTARDVETVFVEVLAKHGPHPSFRPNTCMCDAVIHDESQFRSHVAGELAAALRALDADRVPPGPCWHDPGVTYPTGFSPRCELRAGHAGAHECDRGSLGGTAVWADADVEREHMPGCDWRGHNICVPGCSLKEGVDHA